LDLRRLKRDSIRGEEGFKILPKMKVLYSCLIIDYQIKIKVALNLVFIIKE
jgi:hypothetical protein